MAETVSREVRVRSHKNEEKLVVSIQDDSWGHCVFNRDKKEQVCTTLKRIELKSLKLRTGRKRKRKDAEGEPQAPMLHARLYTPNGDLVEDEVPNFKAWEEGNILEVGPTRYQVCVNVPGVVSLELPTPVMTSCPLVPKVSVLLAVSSLEGLRFVHTHTPAVHCMQIVH